MEKSKIEDRKQYNQAFLRVFDYVKRARNLTQGELAKLIGCDSSLISMYKSGEKKVNEDMMCRLAIESPENININYMLGISEYMLVKNVPDEEQLNLCSKENPDYEVIMRKRQEQEKPSIASEDQSKYNPIPTWADSLISILSQQIKENEALHRELQNTISEVKNLQKKLKKIIEKTT